LIAPHRHIDATETTAIMITMIPALLTSEKDHRLVVIDQINANTLIEADMLMIDPSHTKMVVE
jgi:hypothetical protein